MPDNFSDNTIDIGNMPGSGNTLSGSGQTVQVVLSANFGTAYAGMAGDVTFRMVDANGSVIENSLGGAVETLAPDKTGTGVFTIYGYTLPVGVAFPVSVTAFLLVNGEYITATEEISAAQAGIALKTVYVSTTGPPPEYVAARESMSQIITYVRRLIGDQTAPRGVLDSASSTAVTWMDSEIQDALDAHQFIARYTLLEGRESYAPGGSVTWHDFYALYGDWEDSVQITDIGFNVITADLSDLRVGHWYFAADQLPSVYLSGNTYDLYGAAADICEEWAGLVALDFDFQSADQRFARSQKSKQLLALADIYREKQRPMIALQVRNDVAN